MSLTTASHDSLPYIDRPPTPTSVARAKTLISSSLPQSAPTTPHPLLPPPPSPHFSPLVDAELSRISSSTPLTAIDLSRYEVSPSLDPSTSLSEARKILQAAYTNKTYLEYRLQQLELLDQFGKNAWLVGNSQLEDVLRGVEKDLVETRKRIEALNRERKGMQEAERPELEGGEREWREGVGRVMEVEMGIIRKEVEWRERLKAAR